MKHTTATAITACKRPSEQTESVGLGHSQTKRNARREAKDYQALLLWTCGGREAMEAAVATSTRVPPLPLPPTAVRPLLPSGLARSRRGFASISDAGGGGGRVSGGGGGGGGGGGDDSGAGAAAGAAAVAALGEAEQQADGGDSDAIVLHVGVTARSCACLISVPIVVASGMR